MARRKMSLQYIAGFFDGEGTIRISQTGGFQITIAQKGARGKEVLREIASFLTAHHRIQARLYSPYRQNMYTLGVTTREQVMTLGKLLLPFLHIKRIEVEDHLRFGVIFPKFLPGMPATRLRHQEALVQRKLSSGY